MKIQCDVCDKQQASLFCTADEAALCDGCDHRVHHANKLASKHQRFSLSHPSAKHFPLCDVCQEKRGFVFCQEDRAILCKDCDLPIHSANELTKKHNRFLLTGIKFSANATPYSPKPSLTNKEKEEEEGGFTGSSSISDYLINTIPGMMFEDFLDSHSVPFACSSKSSNDDGNMVSFSAGGGIWVPQAPQMRTSLGHDNFMVPQMTPTKTKRSRLLC